MTPSEKPAKTKPTCYHETGCEEDYPGKRAKKLGYIVGCIGCPQCGVTISGHISNECGFCGYEFFRKE